MNTSVPEHPIRKPRRRWWKRLLIGTLLAVLIPTAIYRYRAWRLDRELEQVVAELDERDPGWRLEEIEKNRRVVPDDENAAVLIQAAVRRIPASWMDNRFWEETAPQRPNIRLPKETVERMFKELNLVAPALAEGRKLRGLAYGRFPITYAPDFFGTLAPHVQEVREVAGLMSREADYLAALGEADQAWLSCHAAGNAGQALHDEPFLISQLVRTALQTIAIESMERILAQGQAKAETLAEARRVFAAWARDDMYAVGLRGERGGFHILFGNLLNGSVQLADLAGKGKNATLWYQISQRLAGNTLRESHIYMLRHVTRALETTKLSYKERAKRLSDLDLELKPGNVTGDVPKIAALLIPTSRKVAEADARRRTHLACACAALAAEEYRLANKRWPESLEQLVQAGLLAEVPIDEFDGQPLRRRRAPDGFVIYSIGPSGKYEGEALDDKGEPKGEDGPAPSVDFRVEFRLWDPERRAQPPRAPAPKPDEQ